MNVLKRVDGGGHRATPQWTRHLLREGSDYQAVCGVWTNALTGFDIYDSLSTQGSVKNCNRCFKPRKAEQVNA